MTYFFLAGFSPAVSPDFGYLCLAAAILMTSITLPSPRNTIPVSILMFMGIILAEIFIIHEDFTGLKRMGCQLCNHEWDEN